jgi:hypothetical protein
MKSLGGRKYNLEHFLFWQLLPNLHGFGIIQKILGQTELTELWSDGLLASLIANAPELHAGQEVIYGDLQRLYYVGAYKILVSCPNMSSKCMK